MTEYAIYDCRCLICDEPIDKGDEVEEWEDPREAILEVHREYLEWWEFVAHRDCAEATREGLLSR